MNFTHWVDAINEYVAANASHPIVTVVMWALSVIDGIFPVVPSESVVVALAAIGQPPWWILIPVAAFGAFCGDNLAYWIGRWLGKTKLLTGGERRRKMVTWATRQLRVRGPLVILVARYIPGGRVIVNAMAGATHYSYRVFVPIDVLASILWASYATAIGAGVSSAIGDNHLLAATIGIVGAIIIGAGLDQLIKRLFSSSDKDPEDEEADSADVQ